MLDITLTENDGLPKHARLGKVCETVRKPGESSRRLAQSGCGELQSTASHQTYTKGRTL